MSNSFICNRKSKIRSSIPFWGKLLVCGLIVTCFVSFDVPAEDKSDDSSQIQELEKKKRELEEQIEKLKNKSESKKDDSSKKESEYDGIVATTPPKEVDWVKQSEMGSKGNVMVYIDKDGVPTEVYVIGVAPISTTMVAVEAEEEASEEAEFNAKAAFSLWMSEHFKVETVRDKKTLVVRKNGEEQSETVSVSKRHAEQMASAAWRGMSIFWHKRADGRYTAVWRWSATEQKLAKMVELLTQDKDSDSLNRKPDNKVKDVEGFRQF